MIDPDEDANAAFERFVEVTTAIAEGGALIRSHAVTWSQARDVLLASDYRDALPGFAFQCLSIFKFRDFILLYHPDPKARRAFLEELLEPARRLHRGVPVRPEPTGRPARAVERPVARDLGSREWML